MCEYELAMFLADPPTEAEWAALDKSDQSSRSMSILLINSIFMGLVAVVIGLRLFTKIFMTAKLFLDDCEFVFYTIYSA